MLSSTLYFVLALSAFGPREDRESSIAAARASDSLELRLASGASRAAAPGGGAPGALDNSGAPRAVKNATAATSAQTKHLTLTTSAPADAVAPGSRVSLVIEVTPKAEMHVYAPGQKELIPISLTLEANRAVKAHAAKFPKPETFKPLDEVQLVYTKSFRVVQDVTVAPKASGRSPSKAR